MNIDKSWKMETEADSWGDYLKSMNEAIQVRTGT